MIEKEALYSLTIRLNSEKHLLQNANIGDRNKALLSEFMNHNLGKGISVFRVIKYNAHLRNIAAWAGKDLDACDRRDIERVMGIINTQGYSEDTIEDYKSTLKVYYRFVNNLGRNDPAPECVRWIPRKKPESKLRREDLVSPDEVKAMILACDNSRDRCIIAMLFECGLRPGELRSIRISDISKKTTDAGVDYFKIRVYGKTGGGDIYVMSNAELLARWLNEHPRNTERDAPLFVNFHRDNMKVMSNSNLYSLVVSVSKKALGREIYPYILRHSAATYWTLKKIPEAVIKKAMRHSPNSRVLARYQHLVSEDLEREMAGLSGIGGQRDTEVPEYKAKTCPRCGKSCVPTDIICVCGAVLDSSSVIQQETKAELRISAEKVTEILMKNPALLKALEEGLQRAGA